MESKETINLDKDPVRLEIVDLTGMRWSGIPKYIKELINVRELTLEDTNLSKFNIDNMFESHPKLKKLVLSKNNLTAIPKSVEKLTSLEHLDISENRLTKLPVAIEKLVNLKILNLGNNQLKELPDRSFKALLKLEELYLNDNYLEEAPNCLGTLTNLKILHLNHNSEIFKKKSSNLEMIKRLPKLEELNIAGTTLKTIPEAVRKMSALKVLDVSHNYIQSLPDDVFENLTNLEKFLIDDTELNSIPKSIRKLDKLRVFNISKCPIGNLPDDLFDDLRNLEELRMEIDQLNNLQRSIRRLDKLRVLYLASFDLLGLNRSSDRLHIVFDELFSMKSLVELTLRGMNLKSIPKTIGNLKNLELLDLFGNELTTIPNELCNLPKLRELYIRFNKLKKLPSNIGNLSRLEVLYLNDNELTEIPDEIGNLGFLRMLDLEYNKIKKIPSSIGDLEDLEYLNLAVNELTELPAEIGNLEYLEHLNLETSKMKTLPRSIENLKSLSSLGMCYNYNLVYSSNNRNTLGRVELIEKLRGKVVIEDTIELGNKIVNEKKFLKDYGNRVLFWNLGALKKLKLDKVKKTPLSQSDMIKIIMKAYLAKSLIDEHQEDMLIAYTTILHNPKIGCEKLKIDPNSIPLAIDLLGCVLKHLNQAIDNNKLNSLQYSLERIAECIMYRPDLTVAMLQDACNMIQCEYQSNELLKFIENRVFALKENKFRILMTPSFKTGIFNSLNHWANELKDVFGFEIGFKSELSKMLYDPFEGHRGNVIKMFLDYFTPEYVIGVLTEEISKNDSMMRDLMNIVCKSGLTDAKWIELGVNTMNLNKCKTVTSDAIEHMLFKMNLINH